MKNKMIFTLLLSSLLLMSACGGNAGKSDEEGGLPTGYTIENIAEAMDESVNYILWSNPEELGLRQADSEPYVGQDIRVDREPRFGSSPRKDQMIDAAIKRLQDYCLDVTSGSAGFGSTGR